MVVRAILLSAMLLALGCSAFDARLDPPRAPHGPSDAGNTGDGSVPELDASMHDSGPTVPAMDAAVDAATDGARDAELEAGAQDAEAGSGDADVDADTDVDAGCGAGADQHDCCLADPNKTEPGVCGCGLPDSDPVASASCSDLLAALIHRYPFDGTGTTVEDVRGTADGMLTAGATLADTGTCTLAGAASEQSVDLPNDVLSGVTDATIEVWLAWDGVGDWTRIFDFGNNTSTEGNQGSSGSTFVFLTPRYGGTGGVMRLVYSTTGSSGQTILNAPAVLPSDGVHHVAAVFDDTGNTMRLYLDGASVGSVAFTGTLGAITYVNNWLGRSNYAADAELGGVLHEARIYNAALTDAQVAFSFAQGPDPAFFQ